MVTRFAQVCSTAAAMVLLAGAASAATCTPTSGNGNSNKTISLSDTLHGGTTVFTTGAMMADHYCSLADVKVNDDESVVGGLGLFGEGSWTLADKTDDTDFGETDAGDNSIILSMTGLGSATSATPGGWQLTTGYTFEKIMITIKEGAGWAAFLIDPTDRSGSWWTETKGQSHASVYYVGKTTPPSTPAVPLPAAGWMLLAGLGALVGFRRKAA